MDNHPFKVQKFKFKLTVIKKLGNKKRTPNQKAEWQAEDAEENAKELMAIAFYYIDEAQIAVMEAVVARIKISCYFFQV